MTLLIFFGCFEKFLTCTIFLPSFIVVRHQMAELIRWLFCPSPSKIRLIKVKECSTVFNTKDSAKIFPSLVDLLSFQFLRWFIRQTSGKKFNILLGIEKCSHNIVGKHKEKMLCDISVIFILRWERINIYFLTKEPKRTTQESRRQ